MKRPWFRVLARMSRPGQPSSAPPPAGRRPRVRLRLEAVEDRTVTSAVAAEPPAPPPTNEVAWVRPADPAPPPDPAGVRVPLPDAGTAPPPNQATPAPTPVPADQSAPAARETQSGESPNTTAAPAPAPQEAPGQSMRPDPDPTRDPQAQVRRPGPGDTTDSPKAKTTAEAESATPSSSDPSPAQPNRPAARGEGATTPGTPATPPAAPGRAGTPATPLARPAAKAGDTGALARPDGPAAVGPDAAGARRLAPPSELSGIRTDHRLSADLSDGALLQRFVADRDQGAFAALVQRHGSLVLNVCRQVLGDWNAAQDASQATFLILARKAGLLDRHSPLGGWLYKVAYRLALRSRATAARHQAAEWEAGAAWAARRADEYLADDLAQADLRQVLREELQKLPEKYRAPLELCYIDGRTHADAAREIGLPRGSVAKRIGEGLERLRERLVVRGVTV